MDATTSPVESKGALEALQQRSLDDILANIDRLGEEKYDAGEERYGGGVHKAQSRLRDAYARLTQAIASSTRVRVGASSGDGGGRANSGPLPVEKEARAVLAERSMPRPALTFGDPGHSPCPWNVGEASTIRMHESAPWSDLPLVLTAVVRGYLDGDWVVLLAGGTRVAHDALAVYATASVDRWDQLPTVTESPDDDDDADADAGDTDTADADKRSTALRLRETYLHTCIVDETAVVEERFAVKGPWTRLHDFCTPRIAREAALCVRGALLVYGGMVPFAKDTDLEGAIGGVDSSRYINAGERLSLDDGRWRSATHARDGGEYAAAFEALAVWTRGHVKATTLSELGPGGDPQHECVRIYYEDECLSFGEGKPLAGARPTRRGLLRGARRTRRGLSSGARHTRRGLVSGAAVMDALALPHTGRFELLTVCRLARSAERSPILTSVCGLHDGLHDGWRGFHYLLDEATGRRTVAAVPEQCFGHAVALPTGEMLLFSGYWNPTQISGSKRNSRSVEIYSPATDTWRVARWTIPHFPRSTAIRVLDALIAGGLLHVLFARHLLLARFDPADAANPVEWRMMHLPYGTFQGTLVHVAPAQYHSASRL